MLAVIADLHGNSVALEAVLRDLETLNVAGLVCLGDVASFGPQPRETLRRVQALGCPVVMGNADAEVLHPHNLEGREGTRIDSSVLFDIVSWCAAQLTEQDRAFLKTLRPTVQLEFKGLPILCFHGSPASYDDVIIATTPDETLAELFRERAPLLLGGHTHAQLLRHVYEVTFVNPGSVGLPYTRLPDGTARNPHRAEYALINVVQGQPSLTFRRVPYDVTSLVAAARSSGMPHAEAWLAGWLDQAAP